MYMYDIKLFAKYENNLETIIHAVRIYNQNIWMEFGIKKIRHTNNEKWQTTNDGLIGTIKSRKDHKARKKETYKYMDIL